MGLTDDAVLLLGPAGLLHLGVEVVVPALTTLLSQPALQVLGNQRPLLRAVLLHQLDDLGNKPGEGSKPAPTSTSTFSPRGLTTAMRGAKTDQRRTHTQPAARRKGSLARSLLTPWGK